MADGGGRVEIMDLLFVFFTIVLSLGQGWEFFSCFFYIKCTPQAIFCELLLLYVHILEKNVTGTLRSRQAFVTFSFEKYTSCFGLTLPDSDL